MPLTPPRIVLASYLWGFPEWVDGARASDCRQLPLATLHGITGMSSQIAPVRPRTLVVCLDAEGVDISQSSTLMMLYNLLESNPDQIVYYTVRSLSFMFLSCIHDNLLVSVCHWISLSSQLTYWPFMAQNQTPLDGQGACGIRLSISGGP